jgi:hypothetical protein
MDINIYSPFKLPRHKHGAFIALSASDGQRLDPRDALYSIQQLPPTKEM